MLRKLLYTILFIGLSVPYAMAQSGTITGKVTDAETGETTPGANVLLVESEQGTATNTDGTYTIENIAPGTYTLRVTFVGYDTYQQQVEVSAGETVTQNIALETGALDLGEVVVSALGFEQDRDQSGISSTNISGQAIAESGSDNLLSSLSAKSSGLRITASSGEPGASAYTLIRGQSTITGSTQPLFVVDGVPVSNSSPGSGGVGGVQSQSRINDINPNDIESVEVLKGSSAAALWGSRAANGVIVITTKSGEGQDKLNVSVGSKLTISELNKAVPLQTSYGQGSGGQFTTASVRSWGDKIADRPGGEDTFLDGSVNGYGIGPDGQEFYPIDEKNSRQVYDHSEEVFENGQILENNLSVSGGGEEGSYYFSASNSNNKGIIRDNSNYQRTSIRTNASRSFGDFTFETNINYVNTSSDRIQQGSNVSGLFLGGLRTPPDFNNQAATTVDYFDPSTGVFIEGRQRAYNNPYGQNANPTFDNPFWTINNVENSTNLNRFIGKFETSWDPTEWLNITNRTGLDTYADRRYQLYPVFNATFEDGELTEQEITELQVNNDLIARAAHQFNEDYSGTLLLGFNINHQNFDNVGATVQNFVLPNAPRDLSNSEADSRSPFQNESTQRTAALYGEASIDAFDMLFVDLTGRAETASTFGPDTESTFFYPSATLAWQFTELGALSDNGVLNFGKLRLSYGTVGRQPPPYQTLTYYQSATFGTGWGPALDAANYTGGYVQSTTQGNSAIQPERKIETEIGTDLRFFNDRLSVSATYYNNITKDAIFAVSVAPSTGFAGQTSNAAELENEGVELEADVDVIQGQDLTWNLYGNWSKNENVVTDLRGTTSIALDGFTGGSSRAVEGEPLAALWGGRFARTEDGALDLNANGFPQQGERGVIGDPNPDWLAGIGTRISYKGASLDVLFDIKHGGDMWNGTRGALYTYGTHGDTGVESTADQDIVNYAGQTIPAGTTFRGRVVDFGAGPVALDESWYTDIGGGFGPVEEQFVEDAGYARLSQVRFSYNWATQGLRETTGLSSIELAITGRNLLLWTDYSGIDPETNLTGATNGRGLDYFQNPNTRSYGFSIQVNY